MIDFMVLGGPRSATTWVANWLTTDLTFCLHDPLLEYTIPRLEALTIPGRRVGISCTASIIYPDWILSHKAKKILLYRDIHEINHSLDALGLRPLDPVKHTARMAALMDAGIAVYDWRELFNVKAALDIWSKLLPDIPFDPYRHHLLSGMNVQPRFQRLPVDKDAVAALIARTKEVLQ